MFVLIANAMLFWQEPPNLISRIWTYLTQPFTFGRITISVSSVLVGLIVVILTILISRSVSHLIEKRIAHRRHIDPGLRYTIARLVKYFIVTVGSLVALKQAFAIDLTSIAVIFTALSVGIGFGLQYLAADGNASPVAGYECAHWIGSRHSRSHRFTGWRH